MATIFECLPDEILLEVCFRLHPFDLVHAFRHLNTRFDALLHDYRFFRHIIIVSGKLAPNYTGNIITYGRRGIVQSLKATVRCRWLDLSHFNSLRKLILLRPSYEQKCQFKTMLSTIEQLRQLEQLTFIESGNEEYISQNIMAGVFPRLRQCHIFRWHNVQDSVYSLARYESLRSLTLDVLRNVTMFVNILKSLPHLITFHVNSFADNNTNTMSNVSPYSHDHLKHLHISLSDLNGARDFHDYCIILDRILPCIPTLETLSIRLTINCNRMNPNFVIGVVLMLKTVAKRLPINCRFDCYLPGKMNKGSSGPIRLRWQRVASDFISEIKRAQVELARQRPTFTNLRCRHIKKRYMEVYT